MTDEQNARTSPLGYLFSFKGSIGRGQFVGGLGVIVALAFCLLFAAASFMDPRGGPGLFIPITIILLITVAWVHCAIVVQRLRDARRPAWHYLIFGPGPLLLLLSAEYFRSLWWLAILAALALFFAPAFFPSKPAEVST